MRRLPGKLAAAHGLCQGGRSPSHRELSLEFTEHQVPSTARGRHSGAGAGVSERGTQVWRPDGLLGYFPKVGHTGKWGLASSSLDPGGVPSPLHQSAFQWRDRVYSQGSTRPSWATLCDTSPRSHVFLTDVFLCVCSQDGSLRAELTAGKDSP